VSTLYTLAFRTFDLFIRFDYIARDTNVTSDIASSICTDRFVVEKCYLQLPLMYDPRLINCARVIEDQICYDIKDANMLFELCHTRYSLHKLIYTHKTGKFQEPICTRPLLTTCSSPGNRVHGCRCTPRCGTRDALCGLCQ